MASRIKNMTEGRPASLIFSFALPLMVGNSAVLSLLFSFVLLGIVQLAAHPVLTLLQTPAEILSNAAGAVVAKDVPDNCVVGGVLISQKRLVLFLWNGGLCAW